MAISNQSEKNGPMQSRKCFLITKRLSSDTPKHQQMRKMPKFARLGSIAKIFVEKYGANQTLILSAF